MEQEIPTTAPSESANPLLRPDEKEMTFISETMRLDPTLVIRHHALPGTRPVDGVYHGTWKYNTKHGWGIQVWASGVCYRGQWMNHLPNGFGVCRWPVEPSSRFFRVYSGSWLDGKREGMGKQEWLMSFDPMLLSQRSSNEESGSNPDERVTYEGEWVNDFPAGRGKLTYPDGSTHIGEFYEGYPDGKGVRIWAKSSSRYEGDWVKGVMHGIGEMIWNNGAARYIGSWKNGRKEGKGRMEWRSFDSEGNEAVKAYEGDFSNNVRHGEGIYTYPDGTQLHGVWDRNVRISGQFKDSSGTFVEQIDMKSLYCE